MGAKLEEGMYKDRFSFQADFRLMVANAKTYNLPDHFVHKEAITLETFFEKQWAIINKTLEAADKARPPPPPTPATAPKAAPRILPPVPKAFPEPSVVPIPAAPQRRDSTPPAASSSRPTIKLKVGSHTHAKAPEPVQIQKPHKKKPKLTDSPSSLVLDAPPPPYVDDGSHDLLQEVLAIEREKNEQRQRSLAERHTPGVVVNGKRKHIDLDEDEILDLATSPKKERPSPPGPSKPHPGPPHKPVPPPTKIKKDKPVDSSRPATSTSSPAPAPAPAPTPAPTPVSAPAPSLKGKEKERDIVPSSALSPGPRRPMQATPINLKKCKEFLKVIVKVPEAPIFLTPVDPARDGCPTYFDEIKHPMDFGTISKKLDEGKYATMESFKADVDLVFRNCYQFNPSGTYPTVCADAVEKVSRKEWPKALGRKLAKEEKRGLQGIMTTLSKDPAFWIFFEPVDPVALGIPTYFDVIPRKDARDLRTIRQKLDSDKYETPEAFEAELELMVQNAIKFNGLESEVAPIALAIQRRVQELMSAWRSSLTKKRKDADYGTPQPAKKLKMG
ncbi:hypothetical protein NLJ89_g3473 [Agrocybe chaxingu]|uniref:Bromo domain-containing protein n=1 Tax=Agrocybe chaxingu TaxID=84603 RepID=A0A9W8K4J5_9AGAR|nr:hypothetical protein NLJ89_g3473 [Agrocybe chaxingu]